MSDQTIRLLPDRDAAMSEATTYEADDVTNKPDPDAPALPESVTYYADDITNGAPADDGEPDDDATPDDEPAPDVEDKTVNDADAKVVTAPKPAKTAARKRN